MKIFFRLYRFVNCINLQKPHGFPAHCPQNDRMALLFLGVTDVDGKSIKIRIPGAVSKCYSARRRGKKNIHRVKEHIDFLGLNLISIYLAFYYLL